MFGRTNKSDTVQERERLDLRSKMDAISRSQAIIEFSYQAPFQDFDASTDTPDFPQEYYLPLMMELAFFLGPKFGVPTDERKLLLHEAQMYFQMALESSYPEGSIFVQPNRDMH